MMSKTVKISAKTLIQEIEAKERRFKMDYKILDKFLVKLGVKWGIITPEEANEYNWSMGGNAVYGIDALSDNLGLEANTLRNSFYPKGAYKDDYNKAEVSLVYSKLSQWLGFMAAIYSIDGPDDDNLKPVYPALCSINNRALSGNGHNSPATGIFVHEYHVVTLKGILNPGYLERKIWAVKEAALRKHNVHVRFEDALHALGLPGCSNVGKSATAAVAIKMQKNKRGLYTDLRSYREAREFLVGYLLAKKANNILECKGPCTLSATTALLLPGSKIKKGDIVRHIGYAINKGVRRIYIFTNVNGISKGFDYTIYSGGWSIAINWFKHYNNEL